MAEYNPSKIIKDGNTYNFRDTTKIPLAGSNQISGDLIPSTDGTVNLGSTSYQWNQAYIKSLTINGVACGDILTHNVSEFVDLTSNQTVGGQKIFSNASTGVGKDIYLFATIPYSKNTPPTAASTHYINFSGNTASQGFANGWVSGYIEQTVQSNGGSRCRWLIKSTDEKNASVELLSAGNTVTFRPSVNNTMQLGLASHAWKDCNTKAINGINPGALSLPSSTYIDIDTTNWDLTCQNELMGSFTPASDGWLMLHVANSGPSEVNFWVIGGVIRINNKSTLNTSDNNNFNMFTIPVEKDVTYNIYGNASEYVAGRSIAYCRFMPCRGNV